MTSQFNEQLEYLNNRKLTIEDALSDQDIDEPTREELDGELEDVIQQIWDIEDRLLAY